MPQSYKELFSKLLTIIKYDGDKNAYIENFQKVCEQKAILNLLASLPEDKQKTIQADSTPEQIKALIDENISKEEVDKTLAETANEIFSEFIEEIIPTLSEDQKKRIKNLLEPTK